MKYPVNPQKLAAAAAAYAKADGAEDTSGIYRIFEIMGEAENRAYQQGREDERHEQEQAKGGR